MNETRIARARARTAPWTRPTTTAFARLPNKPHLDQMLTKATMSSRFLKRSVTRRKNPEYSSKN